MALVSRRKEMESDTMDIKLNFDWEDVTCPICLDFPHNSVLLQCSSYEKGCRPFMCDTDHTRTNCLNRFRNAYGMQAVPKIASGTDDPTEESIQVIPSSLESPPTCPLCRGVVNGWVVISEVRMQLNMKKRCCEEKQCSYIGDFIELQLHSKLNHPHSRPSEIDPAQKLDWENLQQSSDIIDVLSTIQTEVPHGVVVGDYVIEYGTDVSEDEYLPRRRDRWWKSCILYRMFHKFRASRNKRRSVAQESTGPRGILRLNSVASTQGRRSPASVLSAEYGSDESDDPFASGCP